MRTCCLFQQNKGSIAKPCILAVLFLLILALGCGSTETAAVACPETAAPEPTAQTGIEAAVPAEQEQTAQPIPNTETPAECAAALPTETPGAAAASGTESKDRNAGDSFFEIDFLDVGQGDAACVRCDGEAMLIDGGGSANSSLIYSFLEQHGIDRLTCIVATHPDTDHIGGLSGALQAASVESAYCTVTDNDTEAFRDFKKYLEQQNKEIIVPNAGDSFRLGSAEVTFLYPKAGMLINDNTSVVVRIVYGDTSFLFMGDCEAGDESVMLASDCELQSTVLKIAHHGSEDASSERFLQRVKPVYAVISVGRDNGYGHPNSSVLMQLQEGEAELYRTDMHGTIRCISDGIHVVFETEKHPEYDPYMIAGGYGTFLAMQKDASDRTTEDAEETVRYIANRNTKKFHYPWCSSVLDIKESNKWPFTGTREELIEMGYVPCKRCNP